VQELRTVVAESEDTKRREFDARSEAHTLQRRLRLLEDEKADWVQAEESALQEAFTPELCAQRSASGLIEPAP
jgi:hypothetical protein